MAVGACGKPSAVFQGPVGAFCASTGPAASTASFFCTRLGALCDQIVMAIPDRPGECSVSPAWENGSTLRSSHGAIVDPHQNICGRSPGVGSLAFAPDWRCLSTVSQGSSNKS
jgi:hypothetical protein